MKKKIIVALITPSDIVKNGFRSFFSSNSQFDFFYYNKIEEYILHRSRARAKIVIISTYFVSFGCSLMNMYSLEADEIIIGLVDCLGSVFNNSKDFSSIISIYDSFQSINNKLLKGINGTKNKEGIDSELTTREIEVLREFAIGKTYKEIAEKLCVSTETIKFYRNRIFKKKGIKTMAGLTVFAIFNKYVTMDEIKCD